ncbi:hypothetical protein V2J09_015663 [Rumex salicifolius]
MDSLCFRTGLHGITPAITMSSIPESRQSTSQFSSSAVSRHSPATGGERTRPTRFSFRYPARSLFPGAKIGAGIKEVVLDDAISMDCKEFTPGNGDRREEEDEGEEEGVGKFEQSEGQNGNWVFKILHVKSLWSQQKVEEEEEKNLGDRENESSSSSCSSSEACDCEYNDDDEENEIAFDRDSFSKLLKKVSLSDAKLYAQLCYLGNIAYAIPSIKPKNLLKRHRLRYVISSIDMREELENSEEKQPSTDGEAREKGPLEEVGPEAVKNEGPRISAGAAFKIASSAASYLNTRTKSIFSSSKDECDDDDNNATEDSKMASVKATADTVTAVVAAKEEAKQAVADDLSSNSSWPCEWFVCDDERNATRFFVIQGSETMASWQANLLFEPIQFEGLDVFVHRGIYEAAKGIYLQMLPEIHEHIKVHGARARIQFTGHSLGGSLSILINLMLLTRGEVPVSSLLPAVTFGSPSIMCGGDKLLSKLGLPRSHVQAITMHRDIVPRAFSCSYPSHVVEILKAVNGNFRSHPCLHNQNLLYAPMGEMLILQPEANLSPEHDLLPSGSGFYFLTCPFTDAIEAETQLRAAKNAFLNSPHPLEILSDRSAYGNGGTVQRDHDMNSYLRCIRSLIRHELNRIRKAKREERREAWWPLVLPRVVGGGKVVIGGSRGETNPGGGRFNFSGIVKTGNESFKRFTRLIASQHMHLFVVLMFPARVLLMGVYGVSGV